MCGAWCICVCVGERMVQVPIYTGSQSALLLLHSFSKAAFLWKATRSKVREAKMSLLGSAAPERMYVFTCGCLFVVSGWMYIDCKWLSREDQSSLHPLVCASVSTFKEHPGMYVYTVYSQPACLGSAPSSTANSCSDTCAHSWVCNRSVPARHCPQPGEVELWDRPANT